MRTIVQILANIGGGACLGIAFRETLELPGDHSATVYLIVAVGLLYVNVMLRCDELRKERALHD